MYLFTPTTESKGMLSKISDFDLLTMFVYFNLAITKFETGLSKLNGFKINPNILKLFFKKHPQIAQEMNYEI